MSSTISTYLNAIPANSSEYSLAQLILSKITLAASTTNVQTANAAKNELPTLLEQMLNTVISLRRVPVSTVLGLIAAAAPAGGRAVTDIGALGTVTVSGGVITLAGGTY